MDVCVQKSTSKNNQSLREEIIEPSNVYLVPSGDIYALIFKKFSFPPYVVCRVRQNPVFLHIFPIYSTFLVKFTTLQTGSPKKTFIWSYANDIEPLSRK